MVDKKTVLMRCAIVCFWIFTVAFAVYVYISNPLENNVYGVIIHDESIFHCPSCGITRAVYSIMKLDFGSAFYYHAFLIVFAPVFGYILICLTVNLWAKKAIIPYPRKYYVYLWVFFGLWMLFSIFRNFVDFIYWFCYKFKKTSLKRLFFIKKRDIITMLFRWRRFIGAVIEA